MNKALLITLLFVSQIWAQMDCLLAVPANPLSAVGLATPYLQTGCAQASVPSFVQGVILDTQLGTLLVYNPLVIDMGTKAAVMPTAPQLPATNVVGLWFGTNGNTLTLVDVGGSLAAGQCTNGILDQNAQLSIFGQFAYCNAISWFAQAKTLLAAGTIVAPPLGTAIDGLPCPTIRDFFVVDQDQSDNVVTVYIVTAAGLIAQNTTANINAFPPRAFLTNGSDNRLVTAIDTAIGCKPWKALDLADQPQVAAASPLNELHAQKWQLPPIAYVPLNDAMARVLGGPSLPKVNAWRQGTGQPIAATGAQADQVDYCFNMYLNFPLRYLKLMGSLINFPSPDPAAADSLYTFLGQRFVAAFGDNNMGCFDKLQIPRALPPLRLNLNGNGIVVGVVVTPPNNGAVNPIYAATTGGVNALQVNNTPAAAAAKPWSTAMIVGVAVGGGVGLLVIIGFIVAFRAHKVRNFFSGVRDGIATKMRD